MERLKEIAVIILVLFIASCTQKKERLISKDIKQPFVSLDSISSSNQVIKLFVTDSLPFFNLVANGQSIAVICEQNNICRSDFSKLEFIIYMPNREDGNVSGSFTRKEYIELSQLYFREDLSSFYNKLLILNWKSKSNYSEKKMTLIDRVNVTFQEEINKNYKTVFPGGSDWYGYNSFIIFNKYKEEKINGLDGDASKVISSLGTNPNAYINKEDLDKVLKLISEI